MSPHHRFRCLMRAAAGGAAVAVMAAACAGSGPPSGPALAPEATAAVPAPPGASCPAPGAPGVQGDTPALHGFTFPCLRPGPAVDLGRLGGARPVLVNLWASWCLPCQKEMPRLQRAYARFGHRMLFLGVGTLDTTGSARSFLAAVRATYPQVVDTDGTLRRVVGAPGLPVTFVVNPAGRIVYKKIGELHPPDLTAALATAGV